MSNIKKVAIVGNHRIAAAEAIKKIALSSKYGSFGKSKSESLPQPRNTRQYVRTERKIGRNDPCPCRSGLKFKKCHGG